MVSRAPRRASGARPGESAVSKTTAAVAIYDASELLGFLYCSATDKYKFCSWESVQCAAQTEIKQLQAADDTRPHTQQRQPICRCPCRSCPACNHAHACECQCVMYLYAPPDHALHASGKASNLRQHPGLTSPMPPICSSEWRPSQQAMQYPQTTHDLRMGTSSGLETEGVLGGGADLKEVLIDESLCGFIVGIQLCRVGMHKVEAAMDGASPRSDNGGVAHSEVWVQVLIEVGWEGTDCIELGCVERFNHTRRIRAHRDPSTVREARCVLGKLPSGYQSRRRPCRDLRIA